MISIGLWLPPSTIIIGAFVHVCDVDGHRDRGGGVGFAGTVIGRERDRERGLGLVVELGLIFHFELSICPSVSSRRIDSKTGR